MTEGRLNSLLIVVLPRLVAWCMRALFLTCPVTAHYREKFPDPIINKKPLIASFWHYSIIYTFYFLRKYSATVMVSASRDGEYIARIAHQFRFSTVRGSRNNKGPEAFKAILRAVRGGDSGAIVADGSQGPPLQLQAGVILLASKSGVPIMPMAWSASSYWTIRSWDRTVIPKPFSRIDYYYGDPMVVPAKIPAEEVERYRQRLEQTLLSLYEEAWTKQKQKRH